MHLILNKVNIPRYRYAMDLKRNSVVCFDVIKKLRK